MRFLLVASFAASESGVASWLPDAAPRSYCPACHYIATRFLVAAGLAAAADLVECEASVDGLPCDEDPQALSMSETPTANIDDIMADFPLSFIPATPLWLHL